MKIVVHDTGHSTSATICAAFAAGCGAEVHREQRENEADSIAFFYGVLRQNIRLFRTLADSKRDFLFCDNGYMRRGHFDGYYRITRNAWCHDGLGAPDHARLDNLSIEIKPWRKDGDIILVCPPIPEYCETWKLDGVEWQRRVVRRLRKVTKRPIVIRHKPTDPRADQDQPPLDEQLARTRALVAHDSNVALEAAIAGVPVFVTGPSPARALACDDVFKIETPYYPDNRREVLAVLAANQWTLAEMRDGTAQRALGVI